MILFISVDTNPVNPPTGVSPRLLIYAVGTASVTAGKLLPPKLFKDICVLESNMPLAVDLTVAN